MIKTVIARYKSMLTHGHSWTRVQFTKPALDLVFNRDYSWKAGGFSLTTFEGRVPVSFAISGMDRLFDGTWQMGTAHLVHCHSRWFGHIPMTKDVAETDLMEIRQVIGLDFGITCLGDGLRFPGADDLCSRLCRQSAARSL